MTDLVAFLRARYDETAAKAEAARGDGDGRWRQDDAERYPGRIVNSAGGIVTFDEGAPDEEQAEHIVCHDPARVLADIDAKRELLKRGDTLFCECDFADSPPTNPEDRSQEIPHHYDCTAYRIAAVFAVPYADHPDYREEWRL